jgi:hypothetical protein
MSLRGGGPGKIYLRVSPSVTELKPGIDMESDPLSLMLPVVVNDLCTRLRHVQANLGVLVSISKL